MHVGGGVRGKWVTASKRQSHIAKISPQSQGEDDKHLYLHRGVGLESVLAGRVGYDARQSRGDAGPPTRHCQEYGACKGRQTGSAGWYRLQARVERTPCYLMRPWRGLGAGWMSRTVRKDAVTLMAGIQLDA
jgi:hypothetical protein